jgi:hypothetical protein
MNVVRKAIVWVVVSVLVAGSSVVAVISLEGELQVANCVNNILASRNKPSTDDNAALLAFLRADAEYNRKLNAVFAAPQSEQMALFEKFKAASIQKDHVAAAAVRVITRDKKLRDSHPLGKC